MLQVPVSLPGRLDAFVASLSDIRSRGHARELIEGGHVMLNGEACTKPAQHVDEGDVVDIRLPDEVVVNTDIDPRDLQLPVVFEDRACMVINKPAGYAVHPGSGMLPGEATILHGVAHLFQARNLPFDPAHVLVHRLDRDTTGCLLIAKTPEAHIALQQQFADRTVEKIYLAIVAGIPDPPSATIDAPIGRSPVLRTKMSVYGVSNPRDARTTYRTISAANSSALLACDLHTGRTHQIRVHLASIGYPVLGDDTYTNRAAEKIAADFDDISLCLHAWKLSFTSPDGAKPHALTVAPPPAFLAVAQQLALVLP